jgi:hypothetical protein
MSVGTGADDVETGAKRQALAEGEAAVRQLVIRKFRLAQRPLQRRKKPSERLLIVSHMGAAAFAGTLAGMLTLPTQSSPPSRRITVALRNTPSVPDTASIISGGCEEPNRESRKAQVAASSSPHLRKASAPLALESAHCVA